VAQLKTVPGVSPEDLARAERALALLPRPRTTAIASFSSGGFQFASRQAIDKAGIDIARVEPRPLVEALLARPTSTHRRLPDIPRRTGSPTCFSTRQTRPPARARSRAAASLIIDDLSVRRQRLDERTRLDARDVDARLSIACLEANWIPPLLKLAIAVVLGRGSSANARSARARSPAKRPARS